MVPAALRADRNSSRHLVSGIPTKAIQDAVEQSGVQADAQGFLRWLKPVILAAVDPSAQVTHDTLEIASLPDGFNRDEMLRLEKLDLLLG